MLVSPPAVPNPEKSQNKEILERLKIIETRLETLQTKSEGWWKTRWNWVINNKGTSLVLAVILCAVSIFGRWWLDRKNDDWNRAVDARVNKILEAQGGIKEQLTSIQKSATTTESSLNTLAPFVQDVIRHQFESASKLSSSVLQGRLPALRDLMAVATNQNVKIEPEVTAALSQNLLQVHSETPGLVETAGDLINYRSFSAASWTSPEFSPNCLDKAPEITVIGERFKVNGVPQEVKANMGVYRNCRITLDSSSDDASLKTIVNTSVPVIIFYQCLVIYRGGPIDLPIAWKNHTVNTANAGKGTVSLGISGNSIGFKDCKFELGLSQPAPSEEARQLTRLLLAQNVQDITVPLTKNN